MGTLPKSEQRANRALKNQVGQRIKEYVDQLDCFVCLSKEDLLERAGYERSMEMKTPLGSILDLFGIDYEKTFNPSMLNGIVISHRGNEIPEGAIKSKAPIYTIYPLRKIDITKLV